jgi:hypothetical protein
MTKYPVLNALAAGAYISIIGLVMNWGTKIAPKGPSFMAPIAVISLFTLSAAVMGYLFCYEPMQLYFDGKKKAAVSLFLQTVLVFGCLTALALTLLFSGIIR